MVRKVLAGSLAQNVVAPVTLLAAAGVVGALFDRRGTWRFVAGTSVVLWFAASSDPFWSLRLDRFSEGFTHLQYQRFLSAAKPGFFLLAGAVVGYLARGATRGPVAMRIGFGTLTAGLLLWTSVAQRNAIKAAGVGQAPVQRFGADEDRAASYEELRTWLGDTWSNRDGFWRVAVRADRNLHWFMDAPVGAGTPLFKMGFTPGDNFVHKPESRRREVLDALGVRYVISERRGAPRSDEIQRFGPFVVTEHPGFQGYRPAWIRGAGEVEIEDLDLESGVVRGKLSGTGSDSRLVLGVAGYPRWELRMGGEVVEWVETPVWGEGPDTTQAERRAGQLRGGKVHGDDGTEPTLIGAPARDGSFELRYRSTRLADVLALLLSFAAVFACTVMMIRPARAAPLLARVETGVRRLMHPLVLGALCLAVLLALGVRWQRAAESERGQATAWVADGRADVEGGMFAGPLKAGMLISSSVRARRGTSRVIFPGLTSRSEVTGWVALDDESTKRRAKGTWTVTAEVRNAGGEWVQSQVVRVAHRPGPAPLRIPVAIDGDFDLRITTDSVDRPPPVGFDLDLEAAP
jgi:hypothetical protein